MLTIFLIAITLGLWIVPSVWVIYLERRDDLVNNIPWKKHSSHYIGCLFPIIGLIFFLVYKSEENDMPFKKHLEKMNEAKRCPHCQITSRRWQLSREKSGMYLCPKCERSTNLYSVNADKDYPYAKRLNSREAVKLLKQEHTLEKAKRNMKELEEYDKEIQAYQDLQLQKLKEYERKAMEIKNELAEKEKVNNV